MATYLIPSAATHVADNLSVRDGWLEVHRIRSMTIYFLANDFRGRVNYVVVVEVLTIIHYYRMLAVPPLIHLTTKQENISLLSRTMRGY